MISFFTALMIWLAASTVHVIVTMMIIFFATKNNPRIIYQS